MMITDRILNLLFPPKCTLCGNVLEKDETDLCRSCRTDSPECSGVHKNFSFLDSWAAVWYYKGYIRESLIRYKFRRARHYAPVYGRLLAMRLQQVRIGSWKGSCLVAFAPDGLSRDGAYQALTGGTL